MIKAVIFNSIMEVSIRIPRGSIDDFDADLKRVLDTFANEDRTFNQNRKVWIIKNFEKYKDVPFVATAIAERKLQQTLF